MYITLEKWIKEDREILQKLCHNAERKYLSGRLPYPYTLEDADWWLNFVEENEGTNGVFRKALVDGKVVGNISVERLVDIRKNDGEIGYVFDKAYWGKGIATRATEMICKIAFEELSLTRLTSQVYEPNIASRRVLEKNGFTLEGVLKNAVTKGENIYSLCIYGKLR